MAAAPWGGSEELWTRTAAEALQQGHEVYCSVMKWHTLAPELVRLQEQGAQLHLRPLYSPDLLVRIYRRLVNKLGCTESLPKTLDRFTPDVICVNQGGNFDLTEMHWLRNYLLQSKAPLGILCHNFNPGVLPSDEAKRHGVAIFQKAKRLFFVSQEQAHVTQRQLAQTFDHCVVVKNPVNLVNTAMQPWPENPTPQLAMVASLDVNRKGHDVVLEALSHPAWRYRSWHVNIYGDGPDRAYITELIAMYGLTEKVTLHGIVTDIEAVWRQNHLLLLPSRLEAAPLAVMEAMLCGRPVVATAVGTVPEWIVPGQHGFVAPAPTVALFNEALEAAWEARTQWSGMGHQAHLAARQHTDSRAPATFLNLLTELTQQEQQRQQEQEIPVGGEVSLVS